GVENLGDVLPSLLVPRPGNVRVRDLVDQRDLRRPVENGVDVHLLEVGAAVADPTARNDFEVTDLRRRVGPTVRLHQSDDDVRAARPAALALVEHGEGLADAGRGTEIDPEPSARHYQSLILARRQLIEREVELEHVDGLLAEHTERPTRRMVVDEVAHPSLREVAL